MKLKYEAVAVDVANGGQGLITTDDFSHLNDKYVEGICRVPLRPGGTRGRVSNPGVAVSKMAEANLQGIIYNIKKFKGIGCTCTHANVELSKVSAIYHQQDM